MIDLDRPFLKKKKRGRPRKLNDDPQQVRDNFTEVEKRVWIQIILMEVNVLFWNRRKIYKRNNTTRPTYEEFKKVRQDLVDFMERL